MLDLSKHIIILPVLLPLLMAVLVILFNNRAAYYIGLITAAAGILFSVELFVQLKQSSQIIYLFGNWAAPYGIEYRADNVSVIFLFITGFSSFFSLLILPYFFEKEHQVEAKYYISLFLLMLSGLNGVCLANDLFNIYVFMEIFSLALYGLITTGKNKKSCISAFNYLIVGTIGASFYLVGVGLLYVSTGTLNIPDVGAKVAGLEDSFLIKAALAFFITGLLIKVGMFPFHSWLVSTYANASTPLTVAMSGMVGKVMIFVLIKITYTAIGLEISYEKLPASLVLVLLALAGILYGSIKAAYQPHIKALYAFSSVSHIGYVLLLVGLSSQTAVQAAIVYVFNHAVIKVMLFSLTGFFLVKNNRRKSDATLIYEFAFLLTNLSLIGIPLTNGFVMKWSLLNSLVYNQKYILIVLVALSFFVTLIYCFRAFKIFYENSVKKTVLMEFNLRDVTAILSIIITILLGLTGSLQFDLAAKAASVIFE